MMESRKYHVRPEDKKKVLIVSWFHRIQIKKFKGKTPTCRRCGEELHVGDRVHSHRQGMYHQKCWDELYVDL